MPKAFNILIAEDDPNDLELLTVALRGKLEPSQIRTVHDGEELLQYVRGEGRYHNRQQNPAPDLILLDLKMPWIDGLEALASVLAAGPSAAAGPLAGFGYRAAAGLAGAGGLPLERPAGTARGGGRRPCPDPGGPTRCEYH